MQLRRRQFLQLTAGAVAAPAMSRTAWAQAYPTRPVRLVVGFAAGGAFDIYARLVGQWLSERLGQQFVIENKPGAASNIATEMVVRSPADGYTLLLVGPPNAINGSLYQKLSYDFIRDIAPVASICRDASVLVANTSFPAKTIPELIAYAKANPGKINMASAGNGSAGHVAGELFKMMTGVTIVHVPYRGGAPALTDVIGGQVQLMFVSVHSGIEHIKTGRLSALAVTTTTRSSMLPDIPTVSESVPGYDASALYGVGAPNGTPAEIVERLNKEINIGLRDSELKTRLAEIGSAPLTLSPGDFGKLLAQETERWAKVVKFSGAKAD